MKKKLIAGALLLALSLAGTAGIHAHLCGQADKVTWTEQTLMGDPGAAEDLKITARLWEPRNLIWESRLDLTGASDTDFDFLPVPPLAETPDRYFVDASDSLTFSRFWNSGFYMEYRQEDDFGTRLAAAVASRAPADGAYTETVLVKDYFDTLSPEFRMNLPGENENLDVWMLEPDSGIPDEKRERAEILRELSRIFSFPTPEDYRLPVQIVKEDGKTVEVRTDGAVDKGVNLWSQGLVAGDYLYFVVNAEYDGRRMDYALTPGWGLYRLPMTDRKLTPADLELVIPFADNEDLGAMSADPDGSHLLVNTMVDGRNILRVLNNATGEQQLKLDLEERTGDIRHVFGDGILSRKDLAIFFEFQYFTVLAEENGLYRVVMTGELPQELNGWEWCRSSGFRDMDLAYEDGRLAIGAALEFRGDGEERHPGWEGEERHPGWDLGLVTFEEGEPVYAGVLTPSLSRGDPVWSYDDSVELSW